MAEPVGRPDGLRRGGKRGSDNSTPDHTMIFKKSKAGLNIEGFSEVNQLILRAAAIILGTSLDRLLSLAHPSPASSRNRRSDLENSSNTGSEQSSEYTPPGSSESGQQALNLGRSGPHPPNFAKPYGSEDMPFMTQGGAEDYVDKPAIDLDLAGMGTNMEVFPNLQQSAHMYPTPPSSQYSQEQLPNQELVPNNLDNNVDINEEAWSSASWTFNPAVDAYNGNQACFQGQPEFTPPSFSAQISMEEPTYWELDGLFGLKNQVSNYVPIRQKSEQFGSAMEVQQEPRPTQIRKNEQRPLIRTTGTKGKRRGPFQLSEQRQETALTRKAKACVRCSMQRIRCVPVDKNKPTGCCIQCVQAAQTRTRWLPCLRYRITDSELLDNAKCPRPTWTTRWKKMEMVDITNWASDEIKTINVTQEVGGTYYTLRVRKFIPIEGDALARRWVYGGQKYEYECAPYAVADMQEAGRVLSEFSENTLTTAIPFWIKGDTLLRRTYYMAYKYSLAAEREEDRELLKCTLRLWGASRMMSRAATICGQETLGMTPRDYGPTSPSTGKILMPPVFSAQMEIIFVAMILEPTKKEVLKKLKSLVEDNTRRSWLAIYLCIFLLLHSCALLTARDNERGRLQGVKDRWYRPLVIDELHNGAKILLAYFHYCNRGSYPLHMDWTSEDQVALTELKPEQIEFLRETVQEFKKKTPHFKYVLENNVYEDEYYFISQMYERDWKPRHTV